MNGSLQINRRFNTEGRNFTFRFNGGVTQSQSTSESTNFTRFYQRNDSTSRINRHNISPSKTYNLNGRVMWSEPLALATYLQLSYQGSYRYRETNATRTTCRGGFPTGIWPNGYGRMNTSSTAARR